MDENCRGGINYFSCTGDTGDILLSWEAMRMWRFGQTLNSAESEVRLSDVGARLSNGNTFWASKPEEFWDKIIKCSGSISEVISE